MRIIRVILSGIRRESHLQEVIVSMPPWLVKCILKVIRPLFLVEKGHKKILCGITRPTHFNGVTTVVAKLFNAVKPHLAIFGEKDFQQLVVINRMVFDLNMDLEVIGMPIVREKDGLAMSSRNKYLTPDERKEALGLSQSLFEVKKMFEAGERNAAVLIDFVREKISSGRSGKIDYIKICDVVNIEDCSVIENDSVMALAVCF